MKSHPILSLLVFLALTCPLAAQGWVHGISPFRAVFSHEYQAMPEHTGIILTVPVCGMALENGRDIVCFDEKGRQLPSRALGRGQANTALVMCRPKSDSGKLFAYFGSGKASPQANLEYWGGVLCEYYELKDGEKPTTWAEVQNVLESEKIHSRTVLDSPTLVVNPINSREEFVVALRFWTAAVHQSCPDLFVASDDSGYLLVDGAVEVESPGHHSVYGTLRGENSRPVELSDGIRSLELFGVNLGGNFALSLGRIESKINVDFFRQFIPGGKAKLETVEARNQNGQCPVFSYRHLSYMNLGDDTLTETELKLFVPGKETRWEFEDGTVSRGDAVRKVFLTLRDCKVRVKTGNVTADAVIEFPAVAPPVEKRAERAQDYDYYADLLREAGLESLKGMRNLDAALEFFSRRELAPEQVVLCEKRLADKKLDMKQRLPLLLALARASSASDPKKSREAYFRYLKGDGLEREERLTASMEMFELLLYRMGDSSSAKHWLGQNAQVFGRNRDLTAGARFELAIMDGKLEEAHSLYSKILAELSSDKNAQRASAVHGNACREQAAQCLREGRLADARQVLWKWGRVAPEGRGTGDLALWHARVMRRLGWREAAVKMLENTILFEPLLSNLPEVEFECAELYEEMGQKDKSAAIYGKISTEYPNHPLAAKAAKKK